jgi:hypothetical protein
MRGRLLITARDAAAALHLIEISRYAAQHGDLDLAVVTQLPATRYFQRAGIGSVTVNIGAARRPDDATGSALLEEARRVLDRYRPDAILCGLSTPFDGGIDEAVQAVHGGPTAVMQDFWGEANTFFGGKADVYLALDEEGVNLTRSRFDLNAVAIGSPRHAAYAHIDIIGARNEARASVGLAADSQVIGFFGQALHNLEGYIRTLRAWVAATNGLPRSVRRAFRPHPRQSEKERELTISLLRDFGIDCILLDHPDVERSLLVCDVVCSAFSNCTYDVAYLNYFSPYPIITPVSLFFDTEIVDYFRKMVRLDEFPYLKAGLVLSVDHAHDLEEVLSLALTDDVKTRYWSAAKHLANPAEAPRRALEVIDGLVKGQSV